MTRRSLTKWFQAVFTGRNRSRGAWNCNRRLEHRERLALEPLEDRIVPSLPNGVASGDTTQTSTVLWAHSDTLGQVRFQLSTDPTFVNVQQTLTAIVSDPLAPVKIPVSGLTPATSYFYRATDASNATSAGQFRTPAAAGTYAGLHFGVSGDWRGELAPYPSISNVPGSNLDFFSQFGDTIYADYPTPAVPAGQALTLADFQNKHNEVYSSHLGINSFSALRASTSVVATIDDHELTDNFSGGDTPAGLHTFRPAIPLQAGQFVNDTPIYQSAIQAFEQYNPIQNQVYGATGDPLTAGKPKLYRYNTYGQDAAVFTLDFRSFRSPDLPAVTDPTSVAQLTAYYTGAFTPGRTIMGNPQLMLLEQNLLDAQAAGITWKVIETPEPIQNFGSVGGEDHFEGYALERTQLLKFIDDNKIKNTIFVSADFHGTTVNRLSYQLALGGPQIQSNSIEIITGPVAFDKPFGPTVVDLATGLGLLTIPQNMFYNSLPEGATKESFITGIINPLLAANPFNPSGYNLLSATADPLPNVHLKSGLYLATSVYGWTEFTIDAATQQLLVTTWGIPAYSQTQLAANPALATQTPTIVSQFTVDPTLLTLSPSGLPTTPIGQSYTQTITATGGTGGPYTFAIPNSTLPAGLTLSTGGILSGTPTASGTFTFTVTATDSNNVTGSKGYSLTVLALVTLSPKTLPNGALGLGYSQALTGAGGNGTPYAFTLSAGLLPGGLSLAANGTLSGTPTVIGTFSFTVTATDSKGLTGTQVVSLVIAPTIGITPTTLPGGVLAAPYSQKLTASGGIGDPYLFTLSSGSLPTGLFLTPSGLISGTPTAVGVFSFFITASDSGSGSKSQGYTLTVTSAPVLPNFFAVGSGAGGPPLVKVYSGINGTLIASFFAFDPGFAGGVQIAIGDVNGDGVPDVLVAAGPGGGPHVKVVDGTKLTVQQANGVIADSALLANFFPYDTGFAGGVSVAAGHFLPGKSMQIVTGAGPGGAPHVRTFSLSGGSLTQIAGFFGSFYAYDSTLRTGVTVAAGDVEGVGFDEIITGAGPGGAAHVRAFRPNGTLAANFYAYDLSYTGGVFVAVGTLGSTGPAAIVVAPATGANAKVELFGGSGFALQKRFTPYAPNFAGGVRVGVTSFNGKPAIVTGAGPGGAPHVHLFDAGSLVDLDSFFALDQQFAGGVFVAGI